MSSEIFIVERKGGNASRSTNSDEKSALRVDQQYRSNCPEPQKDDGLRKGGPEHRRIEVWIVGDVVVKILTPVGFPPQQVESGLGGPHRGDR